jgi:hypothetical protein
LKSPDSHRKTPTIDAKESVMKTKAERFIDHVQSALIQTRHTMASTPAVTAVWSLLRELEQASRAAVFIPETVTAEEAAREFVSFLYEEDSLAPDPSDAPEWLRAYVIGELELSVSERLS